jgi:hypothetical protein
MTDSEEKLESSNIDNGIEDNAPWQRMDMGESSNTSSSKAMRQNSL